MRTPDFEPPAFDVWSDEVRRELRAAALEVRRLKPGTAPDLDEPGPLYTGPFDTWSGTVEEIMTALGGWVQRADEHCAAMVADPALAYVGFRFLALPDRKSIQVWSNLRGDGVRMEGGPLIGTATLVRRSETTFELWATGDEGFARLKASALRIATSSLEDLLASGDLILLDPDGCFRTEGQPGATFYEEKAPTPRKRK